MKRYSLFLSEELIAVLKELAEKEDTTVSDIIRRAVEVWIASKMS